MKMVALEGSLEECVGFHLEVGWKKQHGRQGGWHEQMCVCVELKVMLWKLKVTSLADFCLAAAKRMPMGMSLVDIQVQGV